MRVIEKVVATIIIAVLCCGSYTYTSNYAMYEMVGDYSAIGGYGTLTECLQDSDWVNDTFDSWETCGSPVLKTFSLYVTDKSDEDPASMVWNNRLLLGLCYVLSFATTPLALFAAAWRSDGKYLKEVKRNVRIRR